MLQIENIPPGMYVLAVSGGVDSMVLLDVLAAQPELKLIVAHFDHDIRPDSARDRRFVQAAAQKYGLPFAYTAGKLGAGASEATAREARYAFLEKVRARHRARAIITAHHQDDAIETAILNIMRGTGRKGLSALDSRRDLLRPLLAVSKQDVLRYARAHRITWREDSTNQSDAYLRNYIRHHIMPQLTAAARRRLVTHIAQARAGNAAIDALLLEQLEAQPATAQLDRAWFTQLPYAVAAELLAAWLRANGVRSFSRGHINRLVIAAMTAHAGKQADVNAGFVLRITKTALRLAAREQRS